MGPDVETAAAADAALLLWGSGPTSAQTSGQTLTPGGQPSAEVRFFLELLRLENLAGLIQSGQDAEPVSGSGKKRLRAKS